MGKKWIRSIKGLLLHGIIGLTLPATIPSSLTLKIVAGVTSSMNYKWERIFADKHSLKHLSFMLYKSTLFLRETWSQEQKKKVQHEHKLRTLM